MKSILTINLIALNAKALDIRMLSSIVALILVYIIRSQQTYKSHCKSFGLIHFGVYA